MIFWNLGYDDFIFFNFKNDDDFFDSLKMNEVWVNALSLEHKTMSLKKTWFDQFLKTMMQVMIFENKLVRHVRMP